MSGDLEKSLDRYARRIVEQALSLRPGQDLYVRGELASRDLALRIGEVAYDAGGGRVHYRFADPSQIEQLVRRARPEQVDLQFLELGAWRAEANRTRSAYVLLMGATDVAGLAELAESRPESHRAWLEGVHQSTAWFHRSVERGLSPVLVAAAPTPTWARRLFPDLGEEAALRKLTELVVSFAHVDLEGDLEADLDTGQDDGLERAAAHDAALEARRRALDALAIRQLHVTGGGNDLRIGLASEACWQSARRETAWGQPYLVNLPSEEVYTTPDRRLTEGRLVVARPFRLPSGAKVSGAHLSFEGGEVVAFEAEEGREELARCLETDAGARYLGEVALVGTGNPLAQTWLLYDHLLCDENAGCHAALGMGFADCFEGGLALGERQLEALGCNRSKIHVDMTFGSDEVAVAATCEGGEEVPLIEGGDWTPLMADAYRSTCV